MIDATIITARDILRNYKQIFDTVKKTNQPTIVMAQKVPQVAIISLKDLETLQQLHDHISAKTLLETAQKVRSVLQDEHLPSDLSKNHDTYLHE